MELKNQILLVILIPIILILLLAVLQVGLLGFVSIPSFQDSLLDFHINRHVNGLTIEMNIIEQEIYIQYQAYFNQIFGVSAHLRHYCFGEFQNYSNWTLDPMTLSPYNLKTAKGAEYQVAWSHQDYDDFATLKKNNPQLAFLITKATQSLTLTDIIINNTRSLQQDLQLSANSSSTDNETLVPINYAATMIHCTNSMVVRFPMFNQSQLDLLKDYNLSDWLPSQRMVLDSSLNFTMKYDPNDPFTSGPSIQLTQIVFDDNKTQCYMTAKVLNTYIEDLTVRHLQQHQSQGEEEHQLFTAIIGSDNSTFTTLTPQVYSNKDLSYSIAEYIIQSKKLANTSYDSLIQSIELPLQDGIKQLQDNSSMNSTTVIVGYGSFSFYFLISQVNTYSTKLVSVVTAPENGRRYVYIQPEQNNFTMPTFILVHYFEETVLIAELYQGTSLDNVRILEIVVLIVIIVLSILIFLFVWYTATKIGMSFEQPIKVLTEFMNKIDIQNMDQEEELINYQEYFNSFEIKSLFQTMNIFVTTIKYSNQKYSNSKHSDAIALMELSRAKDFYKKEIGNMSAVGICANNIGILHMKGGRVFEAVNEMEEAIYIAKLELIEIKELKQWCKGMKAALMQPGLYQNFKRKIQGLANKFKSQVEFEWLKRYHKKSQDPNKANKNSVTTLQKKNSKQVSNSQINTKSLQPQPFISSTNTAQQTSKNNQTSQYFSMLPSSSSTPLNKRLITERSYGVDFQLNSKNSNKNGQSIREQDQESSPQHSPNVSNNRSKQYMHNSYNQSSIMQSQRMDLKESMVGEENRQFQESNSQEERERNNSSQSQTKSELEMIDDKLQELAKKRKLVEAKLQNRQFQLAQFMFTICMQNSDVFIPETLKLFTEFENQAGNDPNLTQSKIVRLINLYVKKALCYIQLGDTDNFKKSEQKAEEYLNKLQEKKDLKIDQDGEEQDFNFVDMFKNVPHEVLLSKIKQLKAIYQLLQGNFKSAAQILTEIIEMGEYYDPEVRDFCLVVLEKIFEKFQICTKPIKSFRNQIQINVYEIVLMIDYSKEMSVEQINLSHSLCTRIFDILQPQDLVGMYGFNDSLHEAFPLQPKGTYKNLLSKQLYMAITAPGGNSKLYQALRFAVKNFFEPKINIQENSKAKLVDTVRDTGEIPEVNEMQEQDVEGQANSENRQLNMFSPSEIQKEITESETDSDEDNFNLLRLNKASKKDDAASDMKQDEDFQDFRNRYKFICIFTEINKQPSAKQEAKLKKLLEKNQVDLMVFNIANQNANMLDLKKLSKITPRSIFVNATANLEQLFGKSRQNQLQKKMYLEFF